MEKIQKCIILLVIESTANSFKDNFSIITYDVLIGYNDLTRTHGTQLPSRQRFVRDSKIFHPIHDYMVFKKELRVII